MSRPAIETIGNVRAITTTRAPVGALGATGPAQIASGAVSGALLGFAFGGPAASVAGAAIGGLLGIGAALKNGT